MSQGFIPPHGGYQNLLSYQKALIVYQGTVWFCDHYIERRDRTRDQMIQAARSGKQNILEGSQASGTSKETEIKLTSVARSSLEELLEDYRDFLRNQAARNGRRTIDTLNVCDNSTANRTPTTTHSQGHREFRRQYLCECPDRID
jgi:four helix bundle protein